MAFRRDVRYIEQMNPGHVRAVADECARTTGKLLAGLSTLDGLAGRITWRSDAAVLYEQRLTESIGLAEGLHDGFDKAGKTVADYAAAQEKARQRVADGMATEGRLGALIAPIVASQTGRVRSSDPSSSGTTCAPPPDSPTGSSSSARATTSTRSGPRPISCPSRPPAPTTTPSASNRTPAAPPSAGSPPPAGCSRTSWPTRR